MAIAGLSASLYLDHNVDTLLAADLRLHGYDVVFAHELGMKRAKDEEHLRRATAEGRVLVTFDLDDFPPLAQRWAERGEEHAGIILALKPSEIPYGELLRRLLALLDARSADDLRNRVEWLHGGW